ncbi:inositol-pentakisphosphate 2-kinase-domain-containing protein [Kalaharituber pfeilii]|nr:inositol-pentakisphosphate 2-kinase-domain-containing protein [Kalaharituber pfeilii]
MAPPSTWLDNTTTASTGYYGQINYNIVNYQQDNHATPVTVKVSRDAAIQASAYLHEIVPMTVNNASEWEYLGEGASNIVYRYTGSLPTLAPYILRIRKALPGAPSTLDLYKSLQSTFIPVLGSDLVCPTFLARFAPGVVASLNSHLARLSSWDTPLELRRRQVNENGNSVIGTGKLDEEEVYGMLVLDMSCGASSVWREGGWTDVAMVEFKPRWLSQSADAPTGWKVCRSCAVRKMHHHRRTPSADSGIGLMDEDEEMDRENNDHYCPLDLASENPVFVRRAVKALLYGGAAEVHCSSGDEDIDLAGATGDVLTERFTAWLSRGSPGAEAISRLRRAQENWGTRSVFDESPGAGKETGKAMAVRDCTVFVRVWARWARGGEVETNFEMRVGDLDMKNGSGGGAAYWRNVERRLRGGGWYERLEEGERECSR